MRWLGRALVALLIAALVAGAALLFHGPVGPLASGPLRGDVVSERVEDWSSTDRHAEIQIEVRVGPAAFSVTTWCLSHEGALYHGGGANRSDAVRMGLNLTYAVAWLRQEENQYLTTPPEIARTLPESLLRLMGYARGAYALGYIGDLRDPIEAVRPDLSHSGFGDPDALEKTVARAGFEKA